MNFFWIALVGRSWEANEELCLSLQCMSRLLALLRHHEAIRRSPLRGVNRTTFAHFEFFAS
jgi:hypothetical protein